MKRSYFDALVSFLLGVSWAFILMGAWLVFSLFYFLGLSSAIFATAMYVFAGLFVVVVLETLYRFREHMEETKKQTRLLEETRTLLKKKSLSEPAE